jgi:phosphoserine aminotransferase
VSRAHNFAGGPATMPEEVLQQAALEMQDWHGSGMSVMEMSHRGPEFTSIINAARNDLRTLLAIPADYEILFLQGGGIGENAIVPMNLVGRRAQPATIDVVETGTWSIKSGNEAKKYGNVHIAASIAKRNAEVSKAGSVVPPVDHWQLSSDPAYVHICTNETIDGIEYNFVPDVAPYTNGAPLVADMSSHILSREIDVARYGVIFAGAQKNIGPAGLTVVIVRRDLLGHALPFCPSAFNWQTIAANESMYNTPPTYAIYIAGLVFQWLKRQGGVAVIEQRNIEKSALLYNFLDNSSFYENRVAMCSRSRMNVPFFLADEALNDAFLDGAKVHRLLQIKGHKSVGGMRASLYNAMPISGVKALVDYMREFERMRA